MRTLFTILYPVRIPYIGDLLETDPQKTIGSENTGFEDSRSCKASTRDC